MHDVAKRSLAIAVAAGGLLITGAAPAVSAVNHQPENAGNTPGKGQAADGGRAAGAASIPIDKAAATRRHGTAPGEVAKRPQGQAPGRHARRRVIEEPVQAEAADLAAARNALQQAAGTEAVDMQAARDALQHAGATEAPDMQAARDALQEAAVAQAAEPPSPGLLDGVAPGGVLGPDGGVIPGGVLDPSGGVLRDNTVEVPVHIPLNLCGIVPTVLGTHEQAVGEFCGTEGEASSTAVGSTGGGSLASGNLVQVPVSAPINLCGDVVAAASAGSGARGILCDNEGPGGTYSRAVGATTDAPGIANGNVVQVPINVPVNVCGDSVDLVGFDDRALGNSCANGSPVAPAPGGAGASADAVTRNSPGVANANVVQLPIELPVDVCGDSVDVVGMWTSAEGNRCANNSPGGASAAARASGNDGAANGNLVQLPVNIPAEVCGVSAAVAATQDTAKGNICANETGATPATRVFGVTSNSSGIGTGQVVQGSANNPVQICGDAADVLAGDNAGGNVCGTGPGTPLPVFPPPPNNPPPPVVFPPPPPPVVFPPPPPPPVMPPPVMPPPVLSPPPLSPPPAKLVASLPHTGADVLGLAGIGAATALAGGSIMMFTRRKGSDS